MSEFVALQIENRYQKGSDLDTKKQRDGRKRQKGSDRGMARVAPVLSSHSMAFLLHSCPSFSSLCSYQQLKCAPGSLHQSLLSESSSSGFLGSEGEPGARVRAGPAQQEHRPAGPHSVFRLTGFETCDWLIQAELAQV